MAGSYDTLAASLIPFGLWQGKGYYLDEHAPHLPAGIRYSMSQSKNGHWVSTYPLVTPFLAAPFYFPAGLDPQFGPQNPRWGPLIRIGMEKVVASLLTALSVLLIYLTARRLASPRAALWTAVAYAFATPAWTISSQALWQHGTSQFLLALALYLLADEEAGTGRLLLLGLIAGLLTANRPQNLFFSAALLWIVFSRHGRRAWLFLLPSAAVAGLLLSYNLAHFSTFAGGYADYRTPKGESLRPMWPPLEALTGLLVSNRGLLTFCPFFLALFLAPAGERRQRNEKIVLGAAWGLTYLLYASFIGWSGGHTYGPRYLSDGLPLLAVWLAPAVDRLLRSGWSRALLAAAIAYSIALQAIGAFYFPGGGSAYDRRGLWTVAASGPVLAFASGPQTPYFLSLLMPSLGAREALPAADARAEIHWIAAPAPGWQVKKAQRLKISVTNRGSREWSSLGGLFGEKAVRLIARWRMAGKETASSLEEADYWLARELAPGATRTLAFRLGGPRRPGLYVLTLEPCQFDGARNVPFSEYGSVPLSAEVWVLPQEGGGESDDDDLND